MEALDLLLTEEELSIFKECEQRYAAERSFYEFAKQAWSHVEGDEPYVDGWHVQAICEHLEAVVRREIQQLLILVPPRCMKSTLSSVMLPAWVWVNRPEEKFLYSSYAASISRRDSLGCRRLIMTHWYQSRWGDRYQLTKDQNTKIRFENNKNGYRIAASVGSSITGEGGSIIVVDDPNNAKDGESEIKREGTNDWWSQVMSTRLNNPKTGCKVIIQQRLHERDLSGYVMENDKDNKWVKLILPMEFEKSRHTKTIILPSTDGKPWKDPRKKDGELLWPDRIGPAQLKQIKEDLGTQYRIASQLQMRPSPAEGGILKKNWFAWWKKPTPPKIIQTIQSWDTALQAHDHKTNAYSACTTWGYFYNNNNIPCIILLSLWRGRLEYPELRLLAKNLFDDYRNDGTVDIKPDGHHSVDMLLVESKASGYSLIQDLRRTGINAIGFDPTPYGDKIERVRIASHYIEAGHVWVAGMPPNYTSLRPMSNTLVELCSLFPNSDARDVVDTMTQVILRLSANGMLTNKKDPKQKLGADKPNHEFY